MPRVECFKPQVFVMLPKANLKVVLNQTGQSRMLFVLYIGSIANLPC